MKLDVYIKDLVSVKIQILDFKCVFSLWMSHKGPFSHVSTSFVQVLQKSASINNNQPLLHSVIMHTVINFIPQGPLLLIGT